MTERLEMRIREIYLRDEDLMVISNEDKDMMPEILDPLYLWCG